MGAGVNEDSMQECNDGNDSFNKELISYINNDDVTAVVEDNLSLSLSQSEVETTPCQDNSQPELEPHNPSSPVSSQQYQDKPNHQTSLYFKLVVDNIDKNTTPRYMRCDKQTSSLHYFHVYAVSDRVDVSQSSNQISMIDSNSIDFNALLPSVEDVNNLKANLGILVSRVLVKHIKKLQSYASGTVDHILHKYSKQMSQKSRVYI